MQDSGNPPKLNKIAESYFNKVQKEIKYCLYDQPIDDGDVVWVQGKRTSVYDLLGDYEIPDKYRNEIVANLSCPSCGFAYFDEAFEVGVDSEFDKISSRSIVQAHNKFNKKISEFDKFLNKYPSLALKHPIGKKMLSEITDKNFPLTSIEGKFYRARLVEDSKVLNKSKLHFAPEGKPSEGRFNHSGQSHLYLSSDEGTAILEILSNHKQSCLVWVQEYEIKKTDCILDLSYELDSLGYLKSHLLIAMHSNNMLDRRNRNLMNWKPDYIITRFISDCVKLSGFNGIKYNSQRNFLGLDCNIVLFSKSKKIKQIKAPRIIVHKPYIIKQGKVNWEWD